MSKRDRMTAESGKMLRANDTILDVAAVLEDLQTKVAAMHAALVTDKTAGVDVSDRAGRVLGKVEVNGSFDTLRPMIGATKTASGVASEAFAGVQRLAGRRGLAIKNEHPYLRIRIDGAAVTDTTGIALEPFAQAVFALDPAVDVPVYVISEAGLVKYGVVEW